jgi:uncharacterized protein YbjQ (UPF0145 family)
MIFTSDLSIDEILLVREAGFEPLELVQGSSYYHIGWSSAPWTSNTELATQSQVMLGARHLAMSRLLEQAKAVGADGVVGMRLEIEREGHHAEFIAMGTAVKKSAGDGASWRDRWGRPFTCDLSGADFWALVRAGYRPVMLAHGVCVYHIAHKTLGQWLSSLDQSLYNQENPQYTQALYDARELAMSRMQYEAHEAGATAGVVAVDVREGSHGWGSHVLELVAVGTGVAPIDAIGHETHDAPTLAIFAQD